MDMIYPMSEDNLVKEMICTFHGIPKGENKETYSEEYLRKAAEDKDREFELTILKKEKNDILMKGIAYTDRYFLIREKNDKIEYWEIEKDFNMESAIEFMKDWDKHYPFESNISPCELRFMNDEEVQAIARKLLADGIKPEYVKNITGLTLEEISKL